jgi:hypothetical protein
MGLLFPLAPLGSLTLYQSPDATPFLFAAHSYYYEYEYATEIYQSSFFQSMAQVKFEPAAMLAICYFSQPALWYDDFQIRVRVLIHRKVFSCTSLHQNCFHRFFADNHRATEE